MAKILLAAELGAGFGHVAPMRALAQQLCSLGHRCTFAVRDLDSARDFLSPELGVLLQAPLRLHPPPRPLKVQLSFASILYSCGFDDPASLATRLHAWRDLFTLTGCDYLIADHSPTAMLAARAASLPTGIVGNGFSIPPIQSPFPNFHGPALSEDAQLRNNEKGVLDIANQALARMNATGLPSLQALFADAFPALLTYPELDHYGLPRQQPYLGLPDFSRGVDVTWGNRREPRLFAYLRPNGGLPGVLKALHDIPAQAVLRVSGVDVAELKAYLRPGLVVVDRQVNIRKVAASCDAYVSYSPHGTTAEMLLAGKPGLLIPTTRERSMVAKCADKIGAVINLKPAADAPYAEALARLLEDLTLRTHAESFAARYAAQDRAEILPRWCEAFFKR